MKMLFCTMVVLTLLTTQVSASGGSGCYGSSGSDGGMRMSWIFVAPNATPAKPVNTTPVAEWVNATNYETAYWELINGTWEITFNGSRINELVGADQGFANTYKDILLPLKLLEFLDALER